MFLDEDNSERFRFRLSLLLAEARLKLSDVAKRLGPGSYDHLRRAMHDGKRPRSAIVDSIADAYGIARSEFVLPPHRPPNLVVPDGYRVYLSADQLADLLNLKSVEPEWRHSVSRSNPEVAARILRGHLGYGYGPVPSMVAALSALGIAVRTGISLVGPRYYSAACIGKGLCMLVRNGSISDAANFRFQVAVELGRLTMVSVPRSSKGQTRFPAEKVAQRFAMHFLLPEKIKFEFAQDWEGRDWKAVCGYYGVSRDLLARRLSEWGLTKATEELDRADFATRTSGVSDGWQNLGLFRPLPGRVVRHQPPRFK